MDQMTTYEEIKKLNNDNRWKTDRVIEYFISKGQLLHIQDKSSSNEYIIQGKISKKDLIYSERVFEQPIRLSEKIGWVLFFLSFIANIVLAIFF